MIQLGLRLHDGEKLPLEELLPLVREKGFTCVHMALGKSMKDVPNGPAPSLPATPGTSGGCFGKTAWISPCWATI